jgi:hypothetical protein
MKIDGKRVLDRVHRWESPSFANLQGPYFEVNELLSSSLHGLV